MSSVTNAILSCADAQELDRFNREHWSVFGAADDDLEPWLAGFKLIDPQTGGGGQKCLEATLGVAAFNFLDRDALIAAIEHFPWRLREGLQLFLQHESEVTFSVWSFDASRPNAAALAPIERTGPVLRCVLPSINW